MQGTVLGPGDTFMNKAVMVTKFTELVVGETKIKYIIAQISHSNSEKHLEVIVLGTLEHIVGALRSGGNFLTVKLKSEG